METNSKEPENNNIPDRSRGFLWLIAFILFWVPLLFLLENIEHQNLRKILFFLGLIITVYGIQPYFAFRVKNASKLEIWGHFALATVFLMFAALFTFGGK